MSERTGRSPIVIENIGPIEKLVLEVPDAGIVVLQGKNGVGKSHALSAISAAFEGKGKLSRRDNADRGLVKAFGAVISVQKSTRYAGRLEVETVVGRYDLATAVNPGIEDPVAADRARIKSLLSIAGITISKRQFLPITHDDTLQQSLMDLHIDEELFGPAEMADIIKKHLESEARVREKKAERLRYRIAALQNKLPDKMEPIDYQEASNNELQ
ncbi:MAG: ATP-binding protein [candidate division KSB1 bacterium]|nr:ATP-binding protein [candidate division KSB1 bacterium]